MRIALVHSFYSSAVPGGENEAVADQAAALARAGHEVRQVAVRTDEVQDRPLHAVRCALTVATGRGRSPLAELNHIRPDVVHVHNLFPNFGRSWLTGWSGPLVATLHNYRPLCAGATLFRDGAVCTACPDGDRWAGLKHGCYRGSRAATLPLAWAGRGGAGADPLVRRADRLLVLSELSRDTYAAAGVPRRRMALVPNFVPAPPEPAGRPAGRWVFVGRLTPEKGILDLLRRWPAGEPLDVVGEGPLHARCREAAPAGVRFLGLLDRAELRRRLPGWQGLVFSSRWYEGLPLIYLEALAAGLPVLALEGSTVPEQVRRQGTGAVARWEEPLAGVLAAAARTFPGLRERCRRVYDEEYGEAAWLARTERVYASVRDLEGVPVDAART